MPPPGGADRAFRRGVRIAAGLTALIVVAIMIVVVNRDHPLKWQPHAGNDAGLRDRPAQGAGAQGTGASKAKPGLLAHPPKSASDLSAR